QDGGHRSPQLHGRGWRPARHLGIECRSGVGERRRLGRSRLTTNSRLTAQPVVRKNWAGEGENLRWPFYYGLPIVTAAAAALASARAAAINITRRIVSRKESA